MRRRGAGFRAKSQRFDRAGFVRLRRQTALTGRMRCEIRWDFTRETILKSLLLFIIRVLSLGHINSAKGRHWGIVDSGDTLERKCVG